MSEGAIFFVGSYAAKDASGIYCFALHGDSRLEQLGQWSGVTNPSFVAVDPGGRHLYAVGETGLASDGVAGTVHAFRIDHGAKGPELVALNQRSTAGDHPCHLRLDRTGRWLAAANYGTGSVAVFPIAADRTLGEPATLVQHSGSGPRADRQSGPHAHATIFTADNRSLIVADLGIDRLMVYDFDVDTGACSLRDEVSAAPGSGPRHLALHPSGSDLFVVNELDNTLTWFGIDHHIRERQTMTTLAPDAVPSTAADVHLGSTGEAIYVSNRGDDSVSVFTFDPELGLQRTAVRRCGGRWPRGFAVAPDGHRLVVANRRSDGVTVIPVRDDGTDLGEPLTTATVSQPSSVAFLPAPGAR